MAKYQRGETVICWRNVKNTETDEYETPSTSMKIIILTPEGNQDIEDADMTLTDPGVAGKYYYDLTINSGLIAVGTYRVIYTAVDGERTTKEYDSFEVE